MERTPKVLTQGQVKFPIKHNKIPHREDVERDQSGRAKKALRLRLPRLSDGTAIAFCAAKRSVETMPKKILLVDNDREYRHAMAAIVRRVGYDVIHAGEIAEAIERSMSDRPDLVMIGDGAEIAVWLKSNQFPVGIPIVIYTAERSASWTDAALSNGATAILTKPISATDVGEVLHKHLRTSRNRPRPIPSPRPNEATQ